MVERDIFAADIIISEKSLFASWSPFSVNKYLWSIKFQIFNWISFVPKAFRKEALF